MQHLRPKKQLGQHFLHDRHTAERIVGSLEAPAEAPVAEIGPGEGALTGLLAARFADLRLVEVDPDAVALLQARFAGTPVQILHEDVLRWDPAASLPGPAWFIGNLPYNISSPFFFLLLEQRRWVQGGVFMIQKEVAERICAPHGSKVYGILSVLIQSYFDAKLLFSVPPGAFRPPPKVMSAVIRLRPRAEEPPVGFDTLRRLVKAAFGQRRKTLRNALHALPLAEFPGKAELLSQRAEQLSLAEFHLLAQQLLEP